MLDEKSVLFDGCESKVASVSVLDASDISPSSTSTVYTSNLAFIGSGGWVDAGRFCGIVTLDVEGMGDLILGVELSSILAFLPSYTLAFSSYSHIKVALGFTPCTFLR